MDRVILQAAPRTQVGRQVRQLRQTGKIPAVVYGRSTPARAIEMEGAEFLRAYRSAGESTLIDLTLPSEAPLTVLVQEVAKDPVNGVTIHVDFRAVSMTEKIEAHIPLKFIGTASALLAGGVLVKHLDRLEVEALPNDLVHEIDVDLAPLTAVGAAIHVSDLVLPKGVIARNAPTTMVVTVAEQAAEEPEPAVERVVTDVEVAEKGKTEEAAAGESEKPKKK